MKADVARASSSFGLLLRGHRLAAGLTARR
jgi:hypothetical protein